MLSSGRGSRYSTIVVARRRKAMSASLRSKRRAAVTASVAGVASSGVLEQVFVALQRAIEVEMMADLGTRPDVLGPVLHDPLDRACESQRITGPYDLAHPRHTNR